MRRIVLACLLLVAPWLTPVVWAGSAADDLAQKFAVESTTPDPSKRSAAPAPAKRQAQAQADKPKQKPAPAIDKAAEEQEMLAAARAEADARKAPPPAATTAAPGVKTPQPAPNAPAAAKSAAAEPPPAPAPVAKPAANGKATVLVVLSQQTGEGYTPKTFDPVICFGSSCYVSMGPGSPARAINRDEALSTKYAISTGAGACAGQLGCVFRGVDLTPGTPLQIVDLGISAHTAHEPLSVSADTTCALRDSDLTCKKPIASTDYRVWIVPEALADQAGADKLTAALDEELPEENVTMETDK